MLQGRHDLRSKQPHIQLPLLVGHAALGEIAHNMVGTGQVPQLGNLLDAVIWCADDLDFDLEFRHFLAGFRIFHLGIGLGHLAVGFISLHRCQVAVREFVMIVDGIPLRA